MYDRNPHTKCMREILIPCIQTLFCNISVHCHHPSAHCSPVPSVSYCSASCDCDSLRYFSHCDSLLFDILSCNNFFNTNFRDPLYPNNSKHFFSLHRVSRSSFSLSDYRITTHRHCIVIILYIALLLVHEVCPVFLPLCFSYFCVQKQRLCSTSVISTPLFHH